MVEHRLIPQYGNGDPVCACGWNPAFEITPMIRDVYKAMAAVTAHVAESNGTPQPVAQCRERLSLILPGEDYPLQAIYCEKPKGHGDPSHGNPYHGTLSGYSWYATPSETE